MIGAALVCLNTQLSSKEYLQLIGHSDAKAIFVDTGFVSEARAVLRDLDKVKLVFNIVDGNSKKMLGF